MSTQDNPTGIDEADFARLRRAKLRLSRHYVLALLVPYFAFIAAIVVAPDALAYSLGGAGRFTIGLVVSFVLIVAAVLLTGNYLRATERSIDPLQQKLGHRIDR